MKRITRFSALRRSTACLTVLLALLLHLAALPARADVTINATNFPDANFRSYLSEMEIYNWSTSAYEKPGSDGKFTDAEISSITSINCSNKNISNFISVH